MIPSTIRRLPAAENLTKYYSEDESDNLEAKAELFTTSDWTLKAERGVNVNNHFNKVIIGVGQVM